MSNTIINCSVFSTHCPAVMRNQGPISQEAPICIIRHRIVKFALAHGTSVPIFNGSPPLS